MPVELLLGGPRQVLTADVLLLLKLVSGDARARLQPVEGEPLLLLTQDSYATKL